MILKILHLSLDRKKYLIKNNWFKWNDLIYRYKGKVADKKFDEFDNALDIINKIRDGKKDLADVKNNQQDFKLYLGEIKTGAKNQKNKKTLCTILKCSIKQGMKLLNFMMIIH